MCKLTKPDWFDRSSNNKFDKALIRAYDYAHILAIQEPNYSTWELPTDGTWMRKYILSSVSNLNIELIFLIQAFKVFFQSMPECLKHAAEYLDTFVDFDDYESKLCNAPVVS